MTARSGRHEPARAPRRRALTLVLGACLTANTGTIPANAFSNGTVPRATAHAAQTSVATIQDLMAALVDPSADSLWAAVSATTTATGTEEKQPRTDAEWLAVRHEALLLIEAANLLLTPGRRVADPGHKTEDADIPGIETPAHIARAIAADPARFVAAVRGLRTAGIAALSAVDARDPVALTAAGGQLDAACEACHLRYWYPHSPRPP
jgi:hypothetical protein